LGDFTGRGAACRCHPGSSRVSLMTKPTGLASCSYLHDARVASGAFDRQSASIVLGEKIFIQTFELDCPAGADSDTMFNHEVCQVLAIEQDDTLG
jgi:hypothetical protein